MKQTLTDLSVSIIDLAGEIGTEAEAAGCDSIFAAEAVMLLRDCHNLLNKARDIVRLVVDNRTRNSSPE